MTVYVCRVCGQRFAEPPTTEQHLDPGNLAVWCDSQDVMEIDTLDAPAQEGQEASQLPRGGWF